MLIKERDAARWAALVAQVCAERAVRAIDQMAVACAECVISPARERLVRDIAERFFADQTSDVEEARRRAAGTGVVEVEGAIPAFAPLPTRTMVESIVAAWEAEREARRRAVEVLALASQFDVPGHRSRVVRFSIGRERGGWCVARKCLPPVVGFEVLNRDGTWEPSVPAHPDPDFFSRIGCARRGEALQRAIASPRDPGTFIDRQTIVDEWWGYVDDTKQELRERGD